LTEQKPLLVVIAGPMGAGKTTFYQAHLKEAFPTLIPPIPHQREAMLREQRSFAVEDLVVDTELLENARGAGYATKVVFVSTEDPNLNIGRILIRMAHGGQSVPLTTIPESYEKATNQNNKRNLHVAVRSCSELLFCSSEINKSQVNARRPLVTCAVLVRAPPGYETQIGNHGPRVRARGCPRAEGRTLLTCVLKST